MNVGAIISRVRRAVGDTDSLQIVDSDIYNWINDAMREIASDNLLFQMDATTQTVAGTAEYSLPPDILKLHSVKYDGEKIRMLTFNEAEGLENFESSTRGRSDTGYIWAGKIKLLPVPDSAKNLVISYTRQPTEVAGSNDTPEVPTQYHSRLVDYCKAQVAEMDDDMAKYELKMSEFRTGVQNAKDHPEWDNDMYPYITVSERDMGEF